MARRLLPSRLRVAGAALRMGNNTSISTDLSHTATANQIQETISDNCVVIFSKTTCSYCNLAKKLFDDMNVNYTAVELDTQENGRQFQDVLHRMTGGRTVFFREEKCYVRIGPKISAAKESELFISKE
ncbi:glutaredoxin 2 isoform X2 [Tiliqua scincoides]|uniref:glutaredoxin 2 isoform X2 n=1 Tax=Tiliqua scincoides TaxID=71010 RepID=UPI0034625277